MDSANNNGQINWSPSEITQVPGLESMRVVQIKPFLSPEERDTLFKTVCNHQEMFQSPGPPGSQVKGSLYCPLESDERAQSDMDSIRKACEPLSKRIRERLPTLFTALTVEPFRVSKISLTLVNGLNGHSGTPHADESGGRFQISLLYYFHKTPKVFRGGELAFYAANLASPTGHSDQVFARIAHEDNVLIAYPSQIFHGITNVRCDSDAFEDGRFVAVGFLGPRHN